MPVSVDIQPYSDSVDMPGEADASSLFSLSGHISISLSSSSSIFQRRNTTRLLLQSLTVTFEGQSEVITPEIGYAPLRLCTMTRELLDGEPIDLTNEGHEESDEPCTWNLIFDIQVPGWLPATSMYGDSPETGTSYALYATATFLNIDDVSTRSFSFSTLCSPFRARTRVVSASSCPIILNRFTEVPNVPSSSISLFPMSLFSIEPRPGCNGSGSLSIPAEILEKIEVLASVPSAISVEERTLPFTLRIRAKDLHVGHRKRLRMTGFAINIDQAETYRSAPRRDHSQRYPFPPPSNQPPRVPLRNRNVIHRLFDVGIMGSPPLKSTRVLSIMDAEESGQYQLSGDGRIFTSYADENADNHSWYLLESSIPLAQSEPRQDERVPIWGVPRASESTPLFSVRQQMHISLRCSYDMPDDEATISEQFQFVLPLRFVRVAPVSHHIEPSEQASGETGDLTTLKTSETYTPNLPAYSQLFDVNGDRKIDYSIPLPLYEPPSIVPTSSLDLALEQVSKTQSNAH